MSLLLAASGICHSYGQTTKGKSFWLCYLENLSLLSNGFPKFSIYVQGEAATAGTVMVPATNFQMEFGVQGGFPTKIPLPETILYSEGSENVDQKGINIITKDPVSVWAHHDRLYFSESSLLLPEEMLGNAYTVITHDHAHGGRAEFVVVATEDSTIVDITPRATTSQLRPGGITFSVMLQKGENYQVQSFSELTGSSVRSRDNRKIAVFGGAEFSEILCTATSHLFDQLYPDNVLGASYIPVPFRTSSTADIIRIVAAHDNTTIWFNCTNAFTLDAGSFRDVQITTSAHITADRPVAVGQFKAGQSCSGLGDCTFIALAPVSYLSPSVYFSTHSNGSTQGDDFTEHDLLVLCRNEDAGALLLDNKKVSPVPVFSTSEYVWTRVQVSSGAHEIMAPGGVHAYLGGFGYYDSYSHFLGGADSQTESDPLGIHLVDTFLCAPGVASFSATNSGSLVSLTWVHDSIVIQAPTVTFSVKTMPHRVFVSGIDGSGCTQSASRTFIFPACPPLVDSVDVVPPDSVKAPNVGIPADCEVFVPSAFVPDGQGTNSSACVYGSCIAELDFMIFDRWGEMVFRTGQPGNCWDGSFRGRSLSTAVFGWSLRARLKSGREVIQKGHLTLIR